MLDALLDVMLLWFNTRGTQARKIAIKHDGKLWNLSFSIDNFFAFVCFSPYIRKIKVLLSQNVSLCQPSTETLLTG